MAPAGGIHNAVQRHGKHLVTYLNVGWQPVDTWDAELVSSWCDRLHRELGIGRCLSDTVGQAIRVVESVCAAVVQALPEVEVGAHLHGRREHALDLMKAAWTGGCRSFDGALGGHGGCPMAKDDLVGNLPTEDDGRPCRLGGIRKEWSLNALQRAQTLRVDIFG